MNRSMVDGAMRFISITPRGAAGSAIADARTSTATAAELAFMRRSLKGTKDDIPAAEATGKRPNFAEREGYNHRFQAFVLSVTTATVIFMVSRNGVVEWLLGEEATRRGGLRDDQ